MNTTELVVAILGVLIGLAAVIWAAAQYRFSRRRTVRISRTKTLLVRKGPGASDIAVRLRQSNIEVMEPYSVTLKLTAQRPNDVAVEAFGGRPLRIDFDADVVSLIAVDGHPDADQVMTDWHDYLDKTAMDEPWPKHIDLPPALLSVAEPWSITALYDGQPDPEVTVKLANVDFITIVESQKRSRRRIAGVGLAIFLAGLLTTAIVAGFKGGQAAAPAFIFATTISIMTLPLIINRSTTYTEEF